MNQYIRKWKISLVNPTRRLFLLSLLLTVILYLYPVNNGFFRMVLVLAILATLYIIYRLIEKQRKYSIIFWITLGSLAILVSLPGKSYNTAEFQQMYVNSLKNYTGVRYVWGGENATGIDCSGLPRRALMDTYQEYGFSSLNGKLLRKALSIWWFDTSAKALLENYRGQTTTLFKSNSINSIAPEKLHPGDFAVTADGIHVLNYLGNQQWIEADPNVGKVIVESVPSKNYWFSVPVVILKWNSVR